MNRSDTILDAQQTDMIERGISARIVFVFFFLIFSKTKQEIKTSQNINELKRAPDDNRQADNI